MRPLLHSTLRFCPLAFLISACGSGSDPARSTAALDGVAGASGSASAEAMTPAGQYSSESALPEMPSAPEPAATGGSATELTPGGVMLQPAPEPAATPPAPGTPPPEALIWPNPESFTNSDPWLPEHHDRITRLEPRVLVVNFDETKDGDAALAFARTVGAAFAEASRYHGYRDAAAPAFLNYQFAYVADLPDAKTRVANGFGFNEFLHSTDFAARVGFRHPDTGALLTVCQMFEQGFINEAWVAEPPADPDKLYETLVRAQVYDEAFQHIAGRFDDCAGNGCIPRNQVTCGVTVRLNELNLSRGPGCATHAQGHGIEGLVRRNVIPYLTRNAQRFFNFGLDARYGTPFPDFYRCSYDVTPCINYLTPTHLSNGPGLPAFDIPAFGDGCGNVHFAPHSRFQYDYERASAGVTAEASCEHYGLGDGANGQDGRSLISYDTYRAYNENPAYRDCGGGWSIYMRQNMPGYANPAKDTQGGPMKNWWPFLFY